MSSFVRFILKHKKEQTPEGDVARDILADQMVNRSWGYRTFSRHLVYRNASQRVFDVVDDLNRRYRDFKELGL